MVGTVNVLLVNVCVPDSVTVPAAISVVSAKVPDPPGMVCPFSVPLAFIFPVTSSSSVGAVLLIPTLPSCKTVMASTSVPS